MKQETERGERETLHGLYRASDLNETEVQYVNAVQFIFSCVARSA